MTRFIGRPVIECGEDRSILAGGAVPAAWLQHTTARHDYAFLLCAVSFTCLPAVLAVSLKRCPLISTGLLTDGETRAACSGVMVQGPPVLVSGAASGSTGCSVLPSEFQAWLTRVALIRCVRQCLTGCSSRLLPHPTSWSQPTACVAQLPWKPLPGPLITQ